MKIQREVELYLIRHGLAAKRSEAYPDDSKRPLTVRGIRRLREEVRGLLVLETDFDLIVTSPLVRARQTAAVFAEGLPKHPRVVESDALAPGASKRAILDELGKYADHARIALVGHEPGIGELAAGLIGLPHAIEFKKGAICRIDVSLLPPAGPGRLRWFMTAKALRRLRPRRVS